MAIEVYSSAGVQTCANAPFLVLFHGRGGDAGQWMGGSLLNPGVNVDTLAQQLTDRGAIVPLTIVSGSIDDSYGVDSAAANDEYAHGPYERYISDELLPVVAAKYDPTGSRPMYIGGLSMGGYAALNIAFDNPGRFAGVGALSPAFYVSPPAERAWMYSANGRKSLFERADAGAAGRLRVFLGDGTNDYPWIRAATRQLGEQLVGRGGDVEVQQVSGGHDIATWRALAEPMLVALFGTDRYDCAG
jgi:enterochelin esterase-like enzyme